MISFIKLFIYQSIKTLSKSKTLRQKNKLILNPLFLAFSLIIAAPSVGFASPYQAKSANEIQAQYQLLIQLKSDNAISDTVFKKNSQQLKEQALKEFQVDLDNPEKQKVNEKQHKTSDTENRIDTFSTALYVISALLLLALVIRFMYELPPLLNEIIVYSSSIISLIFFHQVYLILLAGFSLAAAICFSILNRIVDDEKAQLWLGNLLTITMGTLAWLFDSSVFGFFCIAAFLYIFGLIIFIIPSSIGIIIDEDKPRRIIYLTVLSLTLTILAWLIFYTSWFPVLTSLQETLHPFKIGMLTLLPLGYFSGLSFLRYRLFKERATLRITVEIIGFACELAMITIALLYQLNIMFWIGSIFILWNCMEKFYNLIYKKVSFVMACTLFSFIFGCIAALIKSNMDHILPLIDFLKL